MTSVESPRASSGTVERGDAGLVTGVVLGVSALLVGTFVLPTWVLVSSGGFALVAGVALLGARRWEAAFDRLFGAVVTVPSWVAVLVGVDAALLGLLSLVAPVTVESVVWVGLVACSLAVLTATLETARGGTPSVVRLPLWLAVGGFGTVAWLVWVVARTHSLTSPVFALAFAMFFFYVWVVVPLAVVQRRTTASTSDPVAPLPTVSVIVPAYNEEGYVGRCIDHVLDADYPESHYEVVVVDDGSTDGTADEAALRAGPNVTVHRRPNGGKHAALNYGLDHSTGDIVVVVDADSFVEPDALSNVVASFQANPDAGGVASHVRVLNRLNGVSRLQTLEYVLGINTFRRAFDLFDVVPVVPGCLGAFRREALVEVGGYDDDTLTEDFDVTIKVLKAGWSVNHTDAAVWTEAPFSWTDLFRQRMRWNRGNVEVLWKHRDVFVADDARFLHRLVFPFYVLSTLLAPIVGAMVLFAVGVALLTGTALTVAGWLAFFGYMGALLVVLALRLEGEGLRLVPYATPLVVVYPLFQALVIVASVVAALRATDHDWASVHRMAQDPSVERGRSTGEEAAD